MHRHPLPRDEICEEASHVFIDDKKRGDRMHCIDMRPEANPIQQLKTKAKQAFLETLEM